LEQRRSDEYRSAPTDVRSRDFAGELTLDAHIGVMSTPFKLVARAEHKNVEPGKSSLWAAIRVDPTGRALEADRAPLAIVLVLDTSGSMAGEPIAHVLQSCGIVADLLEPRDQLAIVTFSDHAAVLCGLTAADAPGRDLIRKALRDVAANGSTNMHGGIAAAAGVLATAPAGLRRAMVVLSDGQPNAGISSATELGEYVRGLKVAVSSLGFGLHHDEAVLDAVATAGSGRYAYIPDPVIARVELARAALAHGGVVADELELKIRLAEGAELVQLLPASPLRHGGAGVIAPLGDVFVDEGRVVGIELALALEPRAGGKVAEIAVEGRSPDGARHRATAVIEVDVRSGPRVVDRDAQRDVIAVLADAARVDARAQADRGAYPAAAAILRKMAQRIDACDGFVRNDGSELAELREQIEDEAANYEQKLSDQERAHKMKAAHGYKRGTPAATPMAGRAAAPVQASLLGTGGPVVGQVFKLVMENVIGRGTSNDIVIVSDRLSRRHTRIMFITDQFVLQDLGSTNGSRVNGVHVHSAKLSDGDRIELGDAQFRFELRKP
jgi:Ca-activated chloride channel family protein